MTLNRNRMIREIGRRTRLKNCDVQRVIETLVEVWTEELVAGGRIEIEHFMVIAVRKSEQPANQLLTEKQRRRITVRVSKALVYRLTFNKNDCIVGQSVDCS